MTASSVIPKVFAKKVPKKAARIAIMIPRSLVNYHLQSWLDYGFHYAIFNI